VQYNLLVCSAVLLRLARSRVLKLPGLRRQDMVMRAAYCIQLAIYARLSHHVSRKSLTRYPSHRNLLPLISALLSPTISTKQFKHQRSKKATNKNAQAQHHPHQARSIYSCPSTPPPRPNETTHQKHPGVKLGSYMHTYPFRPSRTAPHLQPILVTFSLHRLILTCTTE